MTAAEDQEKPQASQEEIVAQFRDPGYAMMYLTEYLAQVNETLKNNHQELKDSLAEVAQALKGV